jgi:hypothetical protein
MAGVFIGVSTFFGARGADARFSFIISNNFWNDFCFFSAFHLNKPLNGTLLVNGKIMPALRTILLADAAQCKRLGKLFEQFGIAAQRYQAFTLDMLEAQTKQASPDIIIAVAPQAQVGAETFYKHLRGISPHSLLYVIISNAAKSAQAAKRRGAGACDR